MNTAIHVLYRDPSNYKLRDTLVFSGAITDGEVRAIDAHKLDGQFFVPTQIGLRHLGEDSDWSIDEEDTDLHEIEMIELTHDEPTEDMSINDFVERFCAAVWNPSGSQS